MKRKRTDWIRRAVSVLLTLILCAQAAGPILAVEDGVSGSLAPRTFWNCPVIVRWTPGPRASTWR